MGDAQPILSSMSSDISRSWSTSAVELLLSKDTSGGTLHAGTSSRLVTSSESGLFGGCFPELASDSGLGPSAWRSVSWLSPMLSDDATLSDPGSASLWTAASISDVLEESANDVDDRDEFCGASCTCQNDAERLTLVLLLGLLDTSSFSDKPGVGAGSMRAVGFPERPSDRMS